MDVADGIAVRSPEPPEEPERRRLITDIVIVEREEGDETP